MSGLVEVAFFLVETLFNLYITAVVIRFLLGYFRADFYNPISQFLVKITNPILVPLRKVIPSFGKIDTASIVLALVLKAVQLFILTSLAGHTASIVPVLVLAVAGILKLIVWIFIFALIMSAIMSWFGNQYGNPVVPLLETLTTPILSPIRRFIPPISGIDLSPLVAILALQAVLIFLR